MIDVYSNIKTTLIYDSRLEREVVYDIQLHTDKGLVKAFGLTNGELVKLKSSLKVLDKKRFKKEVKE